MIKARINKFIFQDGKIFLRVKTQAADIKLKKDGTNYILEFSTLAGKGPRAQVAVAFVDDYQAPRTGSSKELQQNSENESRSMSPPESVSLHSFSWGQGVQIHQTEKEALVYFLVPKGQKFAVKVGSIPETILGSDLEIDWGNIQWGLQ